MIWFFDKHVLELSDNGVRSGAFPPGIHGGDLVKSLDVSMVYVCIDKQE